MAARQVAPNRYFLVAFLMVVVPVLEWLVSTVVTWNHVVLWAETTVLVLFATFWVLQPRSCAARGCLRWTPRREAQAPWKLSRIWLT